jgi:uncharacterized protein (TIGR02594 family)
MKYYLTLAAAAAASVLIMRYFLSIGSPNWVKIAYAELGTKEADGSANNPRIIEYHAATSGNFQADSVHWCSSFVNWVILKSGRTPTDNATALSWRNWSGGYKIDKPAYGCIVVFSYGNGRGHVGFVVGQDGDRLQILGGNQSDAVTVSKFSTSQIVAYVMPNDWTNPDYNLKTV